MASKKTDDKTAAGNKKSTKSSRFSGIVLIICLVPLGLLFLPLTVVFCVGMMPTLAAYILDPDREKAAPLTVGVVNFAGTIPYLMRAIHAGRTIDGAIQILSDPLAWIIMYSAAAVGWGIYYGIPPIVSTLMAIRAQLEINSAQAKQAELLEAWGEEIKGKESS